MLNLLMSDMSKQIIAKNPFHFVLENEEVDNFLRHALYTRSLNEYARPPKIFQDLSVSLSLVSNLLEILRVDKLTYYDLSHSKDQKFVIYGLLFEFLRIVCIGNQKVKAQIYEEASHLIQSVESNCESFIKYLFFFEEFALDNPLVLNQPRLVHGYVESFLSLVLNSEDAFCAQSCFLLRMLPKLIKCGDQVFKENQQIVLSLIFDQRFGSVFGQLRGDKLQQFLKNFVPAPKNEVITEGGEPYKKEAVVNDSRIRFIGAYFHTLIACVEKTNPLLQRFCQNVYSLEFFQRIFGLRISNFEFNIPLLRFLIELYLSDKEPSKISINFVIEEFLDDFLLNSFAEAVDGLIRLQDSAEEFVQVQLINEVGFTPMTEVYAQFIDCILSVIQRIISTELSDLSFSSFANKFNHIIQRFVEVTKDKVGALPSGLKSKCKALYIKLAENRNLAQVFKQQKSHSTVEATIKDLAAFFPQTLSPRKPSLRSQLITKQISFFDYRPETENALKPVIDQLNLILRDDKLISHYESNFEKICYRLSREQLGDSEDRITVERVGCALIQSLCLDPNMESMNSRMYLFCFKWLRYYLNSSTDAKDLNRRQNRLLKMQTCYNLGFIFCKYSDIEVQSDCIELYIALLEGKNSKTQRTMFRFISNNKGLNFLEHLMRLMKKEVEQVIEACKDSVDFKFRFAQKLGDNSFDENSELEKEAAALKSNVQAEASSKNCTNSWKFLGLLCLGQFTKSQDLLREKSADGHCFLMFSIKVFGSFSKFTSEYTLPLIVSTLEFLLQTVKGPNPKNQLLVLQSKFFDHLKEYFDEFEDVRNLPESKKCKQLEAIIVKAINLALCAVEGNSSNRAIFSEIYRNIEIECLAEVIHRALVRENLGFTNTKTPSLQDLSKHSGENQITFGEPLCQIFQLYFFIQYMADNLEEQFEHVWSELSPYQLRSLLWLRKYTGSVEVVFQKRLEVVYFIKQPATWFITEKEKRRYLESAGMNSHLNKLYMMFEYAKELEFTADFHYRASHTRGRLVRFWKGLSAVSDHLVLATAALCNILVASTDNFSTRRFGFVDHDPVYFGARLLMICICLLRLLTHLTVHAPLEIAKRWNREIESYIDPLKKIQRVGTANASNWTRTLR